MANPTLTWKIDKQRGTIGFGRLLPVTGNVYAIDVQGGEDGETYTFYMMDDSGEVCLAGSQRVGNAYIIAFNSQALRDRFDKDWHEVRTFHVVCSDGANTVGEGDLSVTWNPVWTDPETGGAYSMKGPQGVSVTSLEYVSSDSGGNITYCFVLSNGERLNFVSPRGPQGTPGKVTAVHDSTTNLWHQLVVRTNRFGEKVLEVSQEGEEEGASADYVTTDTVQTIIARKTFSDEIVASGGVTGDVTGDLTGNVTGNLAGNVTGDVTGNLTGDVTGDVTGDLTGDVTGSVNATGTGKSVNVNTVPLTSANNSKAANVQMLLAATEHAVSDNAAQTIGGAKTFSVSPLMPTVEVDESNKLKGVNVAMLMSFVAANGGDIDGEYLWMMTNPTVVIDGTTVVNAVINLGTSITTNSALHICCVPNVNIIRGAISGGAHGNPLDAFGRCSANDFRNKTAHLDCTSLVGRSTAGSAETTQRIFVNAKHIELPNATSIGSIIFYAGEDEALTVEDIDLRSLTSITMIHTYYNFVGRCQKYIDVRAMAKATFISNANKISKNYDTNCVARCSDGYLKWNGAAWAAYTPTMEG